MLQHDWMYKDNHTNSGAHTYIHTTYIHTYIHVSTRKLMHNMSELPPSSVIESNSAPHAHALEIQSAGPCFGFVICNCPFPCPLPEGGPESKPSS